MSPETIFGIVVTAVVLLFFVSKLFPERQPNEKNFKCSRCGTVSPHTERTKEAWRNNKTKFFCQACHAKWLQSRPSQQREQSSVSGGNRSGCLGVVVLFALIPMGYFLVQAYV